MKLLSQAISILAITLLSTSCIKMDTKEVKQVVSSNYNVDPRLEVYLTIFQMEAAAYNISINASKLTMQFDSRIKTSHLGECYHWEGRPDLGQKILINPELFLSPYNITHREAVLFHEFAHCFLDRGHKDTTIATNDGYRMDSSIMNTYASNSANYENNRTAYIHELFTGQDVAESFYLLRDHSIPSEFPYDEYEMRGEK